MRPGPAVVQILISHSGEHSALRARGVNHLRRLLEHVPTMTILLGDGVVFGRYPLRRRE